MPRRRVEAARQKRSLWRPLVPIRRGQSTSEVAGVKTSDKSGTIWAQSEIFDWQRMSQKAPLLASGGLCNTVCVVYSRGSFESYTSTAVRNARLGPEPLGWQIGKQQQNVANQYFQTLPWGTFSNSFTKLFDHQTRQTLSTVLKWSPIFKPSTGSIPES